MPGYMIEGPVRRIGGYADWTVPRGAAAAVIPLSGLGNVDQFNPYGWRPSGDGTGAYWPHDRDFRRSYGYLPYMEGSLGQSAPAVSLEEKIATEIIATQRYQRKTEKWKLWFAGISTAALVTLTVAAFVGAGRK